MPKISSGGNRYAEIARVHRDLGQQRQRGGDEHKSCQQHDALAEAGSDAGGQAEGHHADDGGRGEQAPGRMRASP